MLFGIRIIRKNGEVCTITNKTLIAFYKLQVKAGMAIEYRLGFKRLQKAMQKDEALLGECVKLAEKMGHKIFNE